MLKYAKIKEILRYIDSQYQKALSGRKNANMELQLYSKLALLELSGWIEQSFDSIVTEFIKTNCDDPVYVEKVEAVLAQWYEWSFVWRVET